MSPPVRAVRRIEVSVIDFYRIKISLSEAPAIEGIVGALLL